MLDLPGKRILVISRRQAFHDLYHGLFSGTSPVTNPPASPPTRMAWAGASAALQRIQIDSLHDEDEGEERVGQALRERKPYALAVVDFDVPYCRSVALAHRLWRADPALLVAGCMADDGDAWSDVASQLECPDRFVFLRQNPNVVEVRQLLALHLHCRALGEELCRRDRETESARNALARMHEEVQEAHRGKTQFLANMTHELHTPMNAILGFTRLLLREPLGPDQIEKLQHVHEAGNRLLRLIDNLLDYSRLSEGEVKPQAVPFHLDTVLHEVLEAARSAVEGKGISVTGHIEEAVPRWLRGDATRFSQVLSHLLSNAVKFTRHGTIHVQTTLDEDASGIVSLRTTVSDTGVGIPLDRQPFLFESFFQADGSTTRQFGGIGLGLTLSKQLVELMGGQIGFRSSPGEGSTFWIILPFERHLGAVPAFRDADAPAPPAAPRERRDESPSKPGPSPSFEKWRVLAVDDDRLARLLVELLLTRAGCFVDLVSDGQEALAVTEWNRYDLMLLDLQVPKTNGLETLRALRQREAGSGWRLPVICLSAHDAPEERQECVAAGADDFVAKPFTPDTLLAAVTRQLPELLATSSHGPRESPPPSDLPGILEEGVRALRWTLDGPDFRRMETRAREIKELAAQAGSEAVADHAMRVQLAARRRDLRCAAAAIDRLDRLFRGSLATESQHHCSLNSRP